MFCSWSKVICKGITITGQDEDLTKRLSTSRIKIAFPANKDVMQWRVNKGENLSCKNFVTIVSGEESSFQSSFN